MDEEKLRRIVALNKVLEDTRHELKHLMNGGALGEHGEPKKRGRKPNGADGQERQAGSVVT